MGLTPHSSPSQVYASDVYIDEYTKWIDRTGVDGLCFRDFLPHINLPTKLRQLGYKTVARVSLPVLNKFTSVNVGFDDFRLMDNHADFKNMLNDVVFGKDTPRFHFLNIGETHYPYMLNDPNLPHLSGVHGVIKKMDEAKKTKDAIDFFDEKMMDSLKRQQVKCVEYLDHLVGTLFDRAPPDTHFIVTSDHGELFGEEGYFGHGPIMHEKVFEVPFVEGKLNQ